MLQRARNVQQQQTPYETSIRCTNANLSQSPVQLAQSWGTPIWTTEYTLKFLEKVAVALKLESRPSSVSHSSAHTANTYLQQQQAQHQNHHQGSAVAKANHRHHHHHKSTHQKQLKGDYIKIEAFPKHQYRPYYQQFKRWPTINLSSDLCPFVLPSEKRNRSHNKPKTNTNINQINKDQVKQKLLQQQPQQQQQHSHQHKIVTENGDKQTVHNNSEMTRKTRNKQVRGSVVNAANNIKGTDIIKRSSEKNCGYCEICRVEYDVLSIHLQTKDHLDFVKNSDNFLALDTLINSSANVETFLKMNSRAHNKSTIALSNAIRSPTPTAKGAQQQRDQQQQQPTTDIDSGLFGKRTANSVNARHLHNHILHNNCDGVDENQKVDDGDGDDINLNDYTRVNGISNNEQLSPKLLSSPRDKLPKYSPPMTRRSHIKPPSAKCGKGKPIGSPIKLNSSENVDEASMAAARARRETAKRINYAEPKEDEEIIDDLPNNINDTITTTATAKQSDLTPPVKRVFRPFARYKVIDDDSNGLLTKTNTAKTESCENSTQLADDGDDNEMGITKDASGLIVKFKRVRESELSKLTYEADNFMFPKQKDEMPTDEDRQSSSEVGAEPSIDLVSSELDSSQLTSPSQAQPSVSELSDQFTSSGRRKKRRAQFDSSLTETTTTKGSKAGTRPRFRESPTQPILQKVTVALEQTTVGTNDRRCKSKRRIVQSPIKKTSNAPVLDASKLRHEDDLNAKSTDSEDRVGENSYNGGSILSSDLFNQYKFAFERVPCNEPWYLAFQRQDESRERIFEYWGNTGK